MACKGLACKGQGYGAGQRRCGMELEVQVSRKSFTPRGVVGLIDTGIQQYSVFALTITPSHARRNVQSKSSLGARFFSR